MQYDSLVDSFWDPLSGTVPMSTNGTTVSPPEPPPPKGTQLQKKSKDVQQETQSAGLSSNGPAFPKVLIPSADATDVGAPKRRKKWFCGLC